MSEEDQYNQEDYGGDDDRGYEDQDQQQGDDYDDQDDDYGQDQQHEYQEDPQQQGYDDYQDDGYNQGEDRHSRDHGYDYNDQGENYRGDYDQEEENHLRDRDTYEDQEEDQQDFEGNDHDDQQEDNQQLSEEDNEEEDDDDEQQDDHYQEEENGQSDQEIHENQVEDVEVLEWTPDDVTSAEDMQRLEESGHTLMANEGDEGRFNIGSVFKGALDGFGGDRGGGGNFGSIVSTISGMISGGGGAPLSNTFSSGGFGHIAESLIAKAAHRFLGVDERTGSIIGAIAGNILFNLGGKGNSLGGIGKMILDNIVSGRFQRKVDPWVSPVPGTQSFHLNFYEERQKCLQTATLFEDPEFPPNDQSLYFKTPPDEEVIWKRPGEIISDPQLIVEGHSRFDVKQGSLGDCWLLAAVANLTLRDELFYRVVPPDQSFTENYAGIFHFQFWRYGKWVDVVIDDKLPTVDGRLIYMHSDEHNEFWSALIEKAYAKMYGSYEALDGGSTVEALEDFTGGLTEYFDLRKTERETVLAMMVRGFQMGGLFGCSIGADPNIKEAVRSDGLVRGHAYSITALHTVRTSRGEVVLVRIRNPWGNSKEWNGAWSDNSSEWDQLDISERPPFEKDGEFWMSFDDFYKEFEEMELCNLSAQIMDEISAMTGVDTKTVDQRVSNWEERAGDGRWDNQTGTAGGCSNYPNSFYRNPQYGASFTVTEESVEKDGKATVIGALLQKYRRELRPQGLDDLPIGFSVYREESLSGPLDMHFLRNHKAIARTPIFINRREVTIRFRVEPGSYVILPSTYEPNEEADFLIRVYANGGIQFQCIQGETCPNQPVPSYPQSYQSTQQNSNWKPSY